MTDLHRRDVVRGLLGLGGAAGLAALAGCTGDPGGSSGGQGGHGGHAMGGGSGAPTGAGGAAPPSLPTSSSLSAAPGQRVVTATLTPRPVTVDLGGVRAATWAYGDTVPGPLLRASAGDLVRVTVDNRLPAETSVHWHGIRLRNVADGVPGLTQPPIAAGTTYRYEFVAPDPGTYFFHPHTGVQLDRGLYAPLIVDDPHEPGAYDAEWVLTLDDWTDGVGRSPDEILAGLLAQHGTVSPGMNMGGMGPGGRGRMTGGTDGMGGMHGMGGALGDAGDLTYPHHLVNGRIPAAPTTLTARPGQRVRLRIVNAAADTMFRVALGGHTLTVTHADGYAVVPTTAKAIYVAMGERYDAVVTVGDGVFPLVASAEGKNGQALALLRTGAGAAPAADVHPSEIDGPVLLGTQLRAADAARLPDRSPDETVTVELNGQMTPYAWGINGRMHGQDTPIQVTGGQRLRMRMTNMTMMAHPMHLHGHTWGLPGSGGLRKDTVLVLPMQTIEADLQADNPGAWAYHCHNLYHGETGMMTSLRYR